ncbi:MAG: hypothetical protein WA809_04400, partial [Candidatus Dormiibacterota bacterium]
VRSVRGAAIGTVGDLLLGGKNRRHRPDHGRLRRPSLTSDKNPTDPGFNRRQQQGKLHPVLTDDT